MKNIITALVVFLSAIAGVAVGDLLLNKNQKPPVTSGTEAASYRDALEKQGMNLDLQVGDLFPLEPCVTADGAASNFESVIMGQPCLILFSAPGCEKCKELYRALQEIGVHRQNKLRVIACVSTTDRDAWASHLPDKFDDLTTVYYDEGGFREKYNLRVIPTALATDRNGFVQYIQIGFVDRLDSAVRAFIKENSN